MTKLNSYSISVVIPNYNGRVLLENNLPSVIRALNYIGVDYEVIVTDDNSSDESINFLKLNYPNIILITNNVNLGFSGNINRGLRVAKKDLVFILNSDIELEENYFEPQLKYFDNENIFGVMGAIFESDKKTLVKTNIFPKIDFWGHIQGGSSKDYNYDSPKETFLICGANTLARNSMLKSLDYFNDLFSPYYGEDVDLGLRALRNGWVSVYDPTTKCFHSGSATIKKHSTKTKVRIISRRNRFIFHDIHLIGLLRFKFFFKVYFDFLMRWIVLDFNFYKSFCMYFNLRKNINIYKNKSKSKFESLEAMNRLN